MPPHVAAVAQQKIADILQAQGHALCGIGLTKTGNKHIHNRLKQLHKCRMRGRYDLLCHILQIYKTRTLAQIGHHTAQHLTQIQRRVAAVVHPQQIKIGVA